MKKSIYTLMVFIGSSLTVLPFSVGATDSNYSTGSQLSVQGLSTIAAGSVATLEDASELTVASVEVVGDSMQVVLTNLSNGLSVTLDLLAIGTGAASLAVGQTVTVITEAAGWMIESSGQVLAFVPNEVGKALLGEAKQI